MACSLAAVQPAIAAPALHFEEDVVGDVFVCEDATYTIISGILKITFHEDTTPSGNTNLTGTLVPSGVVLVDEEGARYRVTGAVWFGGTSNAQQGSVQGTFTAHQNIVGAGGVVDRVQQTGHFSSDGANFFLDKGTCQLPAGGG